MFQLAQKGRQRISQNEAVPELGSGDRTDSTGGCRQFDWRHNETVGANRTHRSSTRKIVDVDEWTEVRKRVSM